MFNRALASLRQLLLTVRYSNHDVVWYQDDSFQNTYYIILMRPALGSEFNKYRDMNGRISANWMIDKAILESPDAEGMFIVGDTAGTIEFYDIGKNNIGLKLPHISSGIIYGCSDIELGVKDYLSSIKVPTGNIFGEYEDLELEIEESKPRSMCNCGARKLGYRDDEIAGHGNWCDVLKVYGRNG